MAEEVIGLLFGVEGGGAIDGRSGQLIVNDLTSIVEKINSGGSKVPKIKFEFDTTGATKAVDDLKKHLKDIEKIASIKVAYGNKGGAGGQGGSITQELQAEMKQFVTLQKQINSTKTKLGKLEIDNGDVGLISAYTQELGRLESQYDKLMHTFMEKLTGNPTALTKGDFSDWSDQLESLKKIEEATTEAAKAKQQDAKDADAQQKKYKELSGHIKEYYKALKESKKLSREYSYISAASDEDPTLTDRRSDKEKEDTRIKYGYVPDFTKRIESINAAIAAFKELEGLNKRITGVNEKGVLEPANDQEWEEYAERLGVTVEQVKKLADQLNKSMNASEVDLETGAKKSQDSWTAYASKVRDEIERMHGTISKDSGVSKMADEIIDMASKGTGSVGDLKDKFDEFRAAAHKSGADLEDWGDRFKKNFTNNIRSAVAGAASGILTKYLREVYQNVVKLDEAIVNLQIASGKNRAETKALVQEYASLAKTLGATTAEVANAADTWLRQGYSAEEANTLITSSTMLSKLGQMEATEASTALTSAMKGYGVAVEDATTIVDKLTKVDMEAAASAGDIATAMAETATSAKLSGVPMDKLIGYITTVKEVTQDGSESVGKQNCPTIQQCIASRKQYRLKPRDGQDRGKTLCNYQLVQSHWGDAQKGEYMGKTYVQTQCDNCGQALSRPLGDYNRAKHHFCNQTCQAEYRHKLAYEDRPCEICGTLIHVAKRRKQRFCSYACQAEWQKTRVGNLNPKFYRVNVPCTWCGKEIMEFPCKVRDLERHFCNEKCRRNWYARVWSQRKEWKEQVRMRAVDILSSGVISFTQSAPQVAINTMLDDMGVKYINEYGCKYFAMDNYLVESGLMLEIMGDFWHTNPVVYKCAKYDKQITRIKSDRAKQTYILNQYGVRILYLWERDINERPEVCKSLIELYIANKGQLENYHSFNYCADNDLVRMNDDLIIPFFEQRDYVANAQSFGA